MEYMEEGGGFFSISFFFLFFTAPSTEMCLFISPCTEHRYIILRSWDISKLALEDRLVLQLDRTSICFLRSVCSVVMLFFIILFWNLCSAVQVHPIHLTHMKEIWWCIITCVQNHNLLSVGKSKFTVHCVYTNLMCVEKSEFTVQLCVHKLTSVKLDQTHTELITGWSLLWILFKECRLDGAKLAG